jgi:PhnB protein
VHDLKRFGDVDQSCPAANRQLVMHAELRIDGAVLMLSDGPGRGDRTSDGDISIALDFDGRQAAQRAFDALAQEGKVVEKLFDAPWGTTFGALVDKFGVSWMFTSPLNG